MGVGRARIDSIIGRGVGTCGQGKCALHGNGHAQQKPMKGILWVIGSVGVRALLVHRSSSHPHVPTGIHLAVGGPCYYSLPHRVPRRPSPLELLIQCHVPTPVWGGKNVLDMQGNIGCHRVWGGERGERQGNIG